MKQAYRRLQYDGMVRNVQWAHKVLIILSTICALASAADTTWSPTGSMSVPRRDHTATLLPSGKVLVVGHLTDIAELYDPTTGTFAKAGNTAVTHGQRFTA